MLLTCLQQNTVFGKCDTRLTPWRHPIEHLNMMKHNNHIQTRVFDPKGMKTLLFARQADIVTLALHHHTWLSRKTWLIDLA